MAECECVFFFFGFIVCAFSNFLLLRSILARYDTFIRCQPMTVNVYMTNGKKRSARSSKREKATEANNIHSGKLDVVPLSGIISPSVSLFHLHFGQNAWVRQHNECSKYSAAEMAKQKEKANAQWNTQTTESIPTGKIIQLNSQSISIHAAVLHPIFLAKFNSNVRVNLIIFIDWIHMKSNT